MRETLVAQYARAVPRYTSYPTAPHFHDGVNASTFGQWLGEVPADMGLSLYIHIPFCDRLCWFCGCTTKQTRRYEPIAAYLKVLETEIGNVARRLEGRGRVTALHFGGGSPSLLKSRDLRALSGLLRESFAFADEAEISLEIDPNDMDEARYDALADIGLTRASLGVQDFDERVQKAINREQSFEQTGAVVDAIRARGVGSVNIDLLYGLPHQSEHSVLSTLHQVLTLRPDRIALFGYAHVPWMKKHQTMIDEKSLPGPEARFAQQQRAAENLVAAGYQPIGIDHFALPGDSLAAAARERRLRRNFQGYTDDNAQALIGLGASSISQLPQGFVQSTPASGDYAARIARDGFAAVRGITLSGEDRIRAYIIERLMCDFGFSRREVRRRFGAAAREVLSAAAYLVATEPNRFFELDSDGDRFLVPEAGRPFVRAIAAHFDAYLGAGSARHSMAI